MSGSFRLVTDYQARGDQLTAIARLVDGIQAGKRFQTLMGVTGSWADRGRGAA